MSYISKVPYWHIQNAARSLPLGKYLGNEWIPALELQEGFKVIKYGEYNQAHELEFPDEAAYLMFMLKWA